MEISNEELELEYKIVNPLDYLEMAHYPGCALKVYCAHLGKENLDGNSHPSIDWIIETTGMCRNTVYKGRRWLVENGKLAKVGEVSPRNPMGRYPVPVMKSHPYQTLVSAVPKDEKPPIPKIGSIDSNACAFAFGFAFGFAVGVGGGQSSPKPSSRTSSTAVPPSAVSEETLEEHKSVKSKSKSSSSMVPGSKEPIHGISGKRKSRVAGDGTPWTEQIYAMSSVERLAWLMEHDGKPRLSALPEPILETKPVLEDLDKVEEPEAIGSESQEPVEDEEDWKLEPKPKPHIDDGERYCSRCGIDHLDGEHRFPDGYGYDVGCRLDEHTIRHFLKFHPNKPCAVCGNLFVNYRYDGDLCSLCQKEGCEVAGKEEVLNE